MKCTTIVLVEMRDGKPHFRANVASEMLQFMGAKYHQISTRRQLHDRASVQYRDEVVQLPIYDELHGPMYDGPGRARYEDAAAYKHFSHQQEPKP